VVKRHEGQLILIVLNGQSTCTVLVSNPIQCVVNSAVLFARIVHVDYDHIQMVHFQFQLRVKSAL